MRILADDLTGAAEVGGICWRYGRAARVSVGRARSPVLAAPSDSIAIVDTETRLLAARNASIPVAEALAGCRDFVFLKTDSVLRGPVRTSIEAALAALGLPRCLLVPCNPSMGRTIRQGVYFIGESRLEETDFRNDPQHPATTSKAVDLLKRDPGRLPVLVSDCHESLPEAGIVIGNAACEEDVRLWAARLDPATLSAGAADFLAAILESAAGAAPPRPFASPTPGRRLLVSGSATANSRTQLETFQASGGAVERMPEVLLAENPERRSFRGGTSADRALQEWTSRTAAALREQGRAVLAIARPADAGSRTNLLTPLCKAAAAVIAQAEPDSVWVEGGSTAAALALQLGWDSFEVISELAPGVVELQPDAAPAVRFVLKPGSYRWPE
jgi:uncharacterized protein YgbK (DUF1537 family)